MAVSGSDTGAHLSKVELRVGLASLSSRRVDTSTAVLLDGIARYEGVLDAHTQSWRRDSCRRNESSHGERRHREGNMSHDVNM